MKGTCYLLLLLLLTAPAASAQFTIGPGGSMTISAGFPVNFDSLRLIPSTAMTLTSMNVERSTVPVPGVGAAGSSIKRVYTITPPLPFTGTAGVGYNDTELNGNAEAGLQLAYAVLNGPAYTWTLTSGSTVNTTANQVTNTVSGVTLARITAASNNVALPVVLRDFSAVLQSQQVLAAWSVSGNEELRDFRLEAATDGRTWREVAAVPATGKAGDATYTYPDPDLKFTARYYRLHVIKASGASFYSHVVLLRQKEGTGDEVAILAEAGSVTFRVNATVPGAIRLYDMAGRLVGEGRPDNGHLTFTGLAAGGYLARWEATDGSLQSRKLVIR